MSYTVGKLLIWLFGQDDQNSCPPDYGLAAPLVGGCIFKTLAGVEWTMLEQISGRIGKATDLLTFQARKTKNSILVGSN